MTSVGFNESICDKFKEHHIDGARLLGLTNLILERDMGFESLQLRSMILSVRGRAFLERPRGAEAVLRIDMEDAARRRHVDAFEAPPSY
ncbi:hypothetical protein BC829DRAFT_385849 [Chytridium lagenaria]|nr:hypothetical protein BC829DRAFT_385849 [Chytridium lagenaria]